MDNDQKIKSFGDLVAAAESLTAPWRRAFALSNILWALALIGAVYALTH